MAQVIFNNRIDMVTTAATPSADGYTIGYDTDGIIKQKDWKSGDRAWHIDTICIGDIKKVMAWTKRYFKEKLGIGKTISWLRISDKGSVYRETTRTIKENW